MKIEGILNLDYKNDDYIMFFNGRNINLTEILNTMFIEEAKVRVKVVNSYSGKELFLNEGELTKDKVASCYYLYHVNDDNLDEVLWNNVGNRLNIEIKNITKDNV